MSKHKDESLIEAREIKKKLKEEKRIRLLDFVKKNPEMPKKHVAKVFAIGLSTLNEWLKG